MASFTFPRSGRFIDTFFSLCYPLVTCDIRLRSPALRGILPNAYNLVSEDGVCPSIRGPLSRVPCPTVHEEVYHV